MKKKKELTATQIINEVSKEQAKKFNWKEMWNKFDKELEKEFRK